MTRLRRLVLSTGLILTIGFGCSALFAPAVAAGKCPQGCPPVKKLHGYPCQFAGCDPATNACLYAC